MLTDCCVCCENALFAGCVDPCGRIIFETAASVRADYELETEFNGSKKCITATIDAGALIGFPLESLNENYYFRAKVKGPSGYLNFQQTGFTVEHDCVAFKTSVGCNDEKKPVQLIP